MNHLASLPMQHIESSPMNRLCAEDKITCKNRTSTGGESIFNDTVVTSKLWTVIVRE